MLPLKITAPRTLALLGVLWLGLPADHALAAEESQGPSHQPSWVQVYGEEGFDYYLEAVAFAKAERQLMVAVAAFPADTPGRGRKLFLWKIGQDGEKLGEIPLLGELGRGGVSRLALRLTGEILFTSGSYLAELDAAGKQLSWLLLRRGGMTVWKLLPLADGATLIAGQSSGKAVLLRVGKGQQPPREIRPERQVATSFYLDLLPRADGSLIAVSSAGDYGKFYHGPSSVWIERFDAGGRKVAELRLAGRFGALSPRRGGFVLLYDRGDDARQDLWLHSYGEDLREAWRRPLVEVEQRLRGADFLPPEDPHYHSSADLIPFPFEIAAHPAGGFMVAGSDRMWLWLARLDARGGQLWVNDGRDLQRSAHHRLVAGKDGFFVVGSVHLESEPPELRNRIRVLWFDAAGRSEHQTSPPAPAE